MNREEGLDIVRSFRLAAARRITGACAEALVDWCGRRIVDDSSSEASPSNNPKLRFAAAVLFAPLRGA
jgi:hypothetical protein